MPLQATSGAASYDAFGGGVPVPKNYIEDVFSTYLYTGNGVTNTITNGIDLVNKGGLVWIKKRSSATGGNNLLLDTIRGGNKWLSSNTTNGESTSTQVSFSVDGFNAIGPDDSGDTYASWTFREQPKFFDVVTWTGTGSNTTIAHNLGSVPGFIIVKRTDTTGDWQVYHRSLANTEYLVLNTTAAKATGATRWNSTTPTSTVFSIGTDATVNASGGTYVAYLFAHDAGGFGLTGTDNVISCGSYAGNGSANGTEVNLGWEPQWLLVKEAATGTSNWMLVDNMRGVPTGGNTAQVQPNTSAAETSAQPQLNFTATGFKLTHATSFNTSGDTMIYIAIRRGPMKVPTVGTSVFAPNSRSGTSTSITYSTPNITTDLSITQRTDGVSARWYDRLRGTNQMLSSANTSAESNQSNTVAFDTQKGVIFGDDPNGGVNASGFTYANWFFSRSPSVFDVVCYTGNLTVTAHTHNLGVAPELILLFQRSPAVDIYARLANPALLGSNKWLYVNQTDAVQTSTNIWNNTAPTASTFTVGASSASNISGTTYVAYLFATCAGVSKVFSYTGNGSSQTINCGFTSSARFVMIKRTDSTGDWYVWDTARGIVAGNDPHLSVNTTAAEVTTDDTIDTNSTGFVVNQVAATNVNVTSATYIGLAIA